MEKNNALKEKEEEVKASFERDRRTCQHLRKGEYREVFILKEEKYQELALGSLRVHSEMYGEGTSQLEQAEQDLKPLLASSPL